MACGVRCTCTVEVSYCSYRYWALRSGTVMRGVGGTLWAKLTGTVPVRYRYVTERYGTGTLPYMYGVVRNGVGGRRQCGTGGTERFIY